MTTSRLRTERAAPAGRRSGLAVAAALLLVLFALGVLLLDVRERGLRLGSGLLLLMLGVAVVGLLWGRRAGYWTGFVISALLAVFIVFSLADAGLSAGGVIVMAIGVAPALLLLPPAARRPFEEHAAKRPLPEASPPVDAEERSRDDRAGGRTWPQGWTKPLARGWPMFGFMILISVLMTLAGLGMIAAGQGADWLIGAATALFGLACGIGATLFGPTRRPGGGRTRVRLETVELDDRQERGVAFPYSRLRLAAAFFIGGAMALAIVGLALGELSSDGSGGWQPWLAAFGGLMLIAVIYLGARKGMGRRWRRAVSGRLTLASAANRLLRNDLQLSLLSMHLYNRKRDVAGLPPRSRAERQAAVRRTDARPRQGGSP